MSILSSRLKFTDCHINRYIQRIIAIDSSVHKLLLCVANTYCCGNTGDSDDSQKSGADDDDEQTPHHHKFSSHFLSPKRPSKVVRKKLPVKSRIPDYDEFARFRDSSRPPDSHYSVPEKVSHPPAEESSSNTQSPEVPTEESTAQETPEEPATKPEEESPAKTPEEPSDPSEESKK